MKRIMYESSMIYPQEDAVGLSMNPLPSLSY